MKAVKIVPVDEAREFHAHELFFSITDRRGVIAAGNDVFARISAYDEADMVGRAHNLIRHPDMPKAVFRLIWQYLGRGEAVAGYVKNMASDGRYYWVVAVITPQQTGYLSVRFKPTGRYFDVVKSVYQEMRVIERERKADGVDDTSAMDASTECLMAALGGAGFGSYDDFMTAMLLDELRSRDAVVSSASRVMLPTRLRESVGITRDAAETIYQVCWAAYRDINRLYASLENYARLDQELRGDFARIAQLTEDLRLAALNVTIKATQLGDDGACTSVVAGFLGTACADQSEVCEKFARQIKEVASHLQKAVFNMTAARLQMEMVMLFTHEVVNGKSGRSRQGHIDTLQAAFDATILPALQTLQSAEAELSHVRGHSEDLTQRAISLQVAQMTGSIEASRLDDTLRQTFSDLRHQTDQCRGDAVVLETTLQRFMAVTASSPMIIARLDPAIANVRRGLKELSGIVSLDAVPAEIRTPLSGLAREHERERRALCVA